MSNLLGIEFVWLTPERVVATMQTDDKQMQPLGFLHGGASVALAESVAVAGAWLNVGTSKTVCNSSINADHLSYPLSEARITAIGIPDYVDPDRQVWQVALRDEAGRRVCAARCTLVILDSKPKSSDEKS